MIILLQYLFDVVLVLSSGLQRKSHALCKSHKINLRGLQIIFNKEEK